MTELSILIVDDEPLMRLSMVDALEAVGHDVQAAATGTEGVDLVRKRTFDLVITDLRLPGADGLTVLKASKGEACPDRSGGDYGARIRRDRRRGDEARERLTTSPSRFKWMSCC